MTPTAAPALPIRGIQAGFRRFSVAEYDRMIANGVLGEDDHLELIEGYLVMKMPRNPPHDGRLLRLDKMLIRLLPDGWDRRVQMALTLADSVPELDLAIVRTDPADYTTRHPNPKDFGIVIEVSDSTLDGDRADKGRIYARAGLPTYWIVNIADRRVEVYTQPSGPTATAGYARRDDRNLGDHLELVLDGAVVAKFAVADVFR